MTLSWEEAMKSFTFRRTISLFVALAVGLWGWAAHAQDYPSNVTGASVRTTWNPEHTKCQIAVEIQNLTRDQLTSVPEQPPIRGFLSFPRILSTSELTKIGQPELPFVRTAIEVPRGALVDVQLDSLQTTSEWIDIDVAPATAPWPEIPGAPRPTFAPDEQIYRSRAFRPGDNPVVLGGREDFRGVSSQAIEFYPVVCSPGLRIVRTRKIIATLYVTVPGATPAESWRSSRTTSDLHYSSAFAREYLAIATGYQPPRQLAVLDTARRTNYLVVIPDEFVAAINPLIARKTGSGLVVKIARFSELGIQQGDSADSRRTKIQTSIASEYHASPGLSYVLLVGDATLIPPY